MLCNLTIWIHNLASNIKKLKEVLHIIFYIDIICILTTKSTTKNNIFIKKEGSQHVVPFTFFIFETRLWIQIVNLNVTFLARLFVKKPCLFFINFYKINGRGTVKHFIPI